MAEKNNGPMVTGEDDEERLQVHLINENPNTKYYNRKTALNIITLRVMDKRFGSHFKLFGRVALLAESAQMNVNGFGGNRFADVLKGTLSERTIEQR